MFGKNVIMKVVRDTAGTLDVHSIFSTIQGEGPFAGCPSIFVRLWACSLACSWCDTEFESTRVPFTAEELLAKIDKMAEQMVEPLIVLTGGEPMRQNLVPFLKLATERYAVQIETAGVHWQSDLEELCGDGRVHIVVSPKTHKLHPEIAQYATAFKYIVGAYDELSPEDGLPVMAVSQRGEPATATLYRPPGDGSFAGCVYVQPLDSQDEVKNKNALQLCIGIAMKHGYWLSLQQHKILGLP